MPLGGTPPNAARPVWHKNVSMDAISSSVPTSAPLLRKRHSAYVLPSAQDRSVAAAPGNPPQRPLQNPTHPGFTLHPSHIHQKSKVRSRPSTANSRFERLTLSDLSADENPTTPMSGSGSSSPASMRPRPSLSTGSVADVTPWDLYPPPGRSSMVTGRVEEVTPWELHPIPDAIPTRSTLATGPTEEVTPWDLFPSPTLSSNLPSSSPISQKASRSSPRISTSSTSQGKTLSDLTHIRRRRSTSAKVAKTHPNTSSGPSHEGIWPASGNTQRHVRSPFNKRLTLQFTKSAPSTPRNANASSRPGVPPLSTLPPPRITRAQSAGSPVSVMDQKFSTADRTILEELKRTIQARASQFTMKGAEASAGPGFERRGRKHHAYPREEVPYPRNFEREVLDLDIWETALLQDTCESPTWHVFEVPPTKVLDLGCGTGIWTLNSARTWKNTEFVGLDIAPLQPDLQHVGSSDLASRITWVHANFLGGLPFPDEEFDFVHIKRIALGVPEDKWDFLFEEITRIMKPGAAFEMFEEDLFFPGKLMDNDSGSSSSSSSDDDDTEQSPCLDHHEGAAHLSAFSGSHEQLSAMPQEAIVISKKNEDEAQDLLSQVIVDYDVPEQDQKVNDWVDNHTLRPSSPRPQLHVEALTDSHNASSMSSVVRPDATSLDARGEIVLPPIVPSRSREYSVTGSEHAHTPDSVTWQEDLRGVVEAHNPALLSPKYSPLLLRTIPKPPANPRDHSSLEFIYKQMLSSRFINLSPLALLANSLGTYFKDVRTHPPVQYAFPPVPIKPTRPPMDNILAHSDYDLSDSDDAREAIVPSPLPRVKQKRNSETISSKDPGPTDGDLPEAERYVNVRTLIQHTSRYITLDETRITAFSPTTKTTFLSDGKTSRTNRLPNTTAHLDLKALNLHLSLRTAEIVACSEAMWEWVVECQKTNRPKVRPLRSGSIDGGGSSFDHEKSILELTREEFDHLISKFDMDMQDQFSHSHALKERFSWTAMPLPTPVERRNFELACEKWDRWQLDHLAPEDDRASLRRSKYSPSLNTSSSDGNDHGRRSNEGEREREVCSGRVSPTRRLSRALRVFVAWKA